MKYLQENLFLHHMVKTFVVDFRLSKNLKNQRMAESTIETELFKEFTNCMKSECNFVVSCSISTIIKNWIELHAYVFKGLREQNIIECIWLLNKKHSEVDIEKQWREFQLIEETICHTNGSPSKLYKFYTKGGKIDTNHSFLVFLK